MSQPRPLRRGDLAAAAAIHAAGFPDEPWAAAQLGLLLDAPGVAGWALEQPAGALAAFLLLRQAADEAEVLTLAVAPACRRAGLASGLLRHGLAAALATGAGRCLLEVGEDNAAALRLYRGLGFREVGRRRRYYRRGADALILSVDLCESQDRKS